MRLGAGSSMPIGGPREDLMKTHYGRARSVKRLQVDTSLRNLPEYNRKRNDIPVGSFTQMSRYEASSPS